ncbi:hypothetical protein [Candidatus Caldatribacterium sp.]|uniref:hypothetical protein n=1 Tax=Candidatus Caldatribacterium sp. TaxID=2282143 RepID=UPI003872FF43
MASKKITWLLNNGAFVGSQLQHEYMVAIWKLLGYERGEGCTVQLYEQHGQQADNLVSEAKSKSQDWYPCKGQQVAILIVVQNEGQNNHEGQDILVIAENAKDPCL